MHVRLIRLEITRVCMCERSLCVCVCVCVSFAELVKIAA